MKPVIRAFLVAPLAAPVLYWIIAFISAVADPTRRGQALGSPFAGIAFVFVFGGLIAYAVMLVAGVPTYLVLRRAGVLGLASLLVGGVGIGVASAFALAPYLRGDLFSIPLSPLHGAALGAAVAAVFWALTRTPGP